MYKGAEEGALSEREIMSEIEIIRERESSHNFAITWQETENCI